MTIGKKLLVYITLTITFSSLAFGSILVWYLYTYEYAEATDHIETISKLKAEAVKNYINDSKLYISSLGASSVFRDFLKLSPGVAGYETKRLSTNQRLVRTINSDPTLSEIFLIDPSGKIVASTNRQNVGKNVSDQTYFIQGKAQTYVKEANSLMSTPIMDDVTEKLLGVAAVKIVPGYVEKFATDDGVGSTGEVFLINKDGYFITNSKYLGDSVILTKQISTANTQACFDPSGLTQKTSFGNVFFFNDYRGVPSIGTNAYITEPGWCLITKQDQSEFYSPIRNLAITTVGGTLLATVIAVILLQFVATKLVGSIKKLKEGVEIIESGNLDYNVGTSDADEIGQLSRSFDHAVQSLKESRASVDAKVAEQTQEIIKKSAEMQDQQTAILNILEDVEDEKNKTSRERDKINVILQSIGDAVFVTDAKLNITLINRKALELGRLTSPADVLGKNFTESFRFANESDINIVQNDFIQRALTEGKTTEIAIHTVLIRKDGTAIVVADSCAPLKDKNGTVVGCVVVFRNVTKERAVDRMKTEFVSLSSHQLRTPLTAVKWGLETLLNGEAGDLNDKQKDYLKDINDSNEREIELVNSLLNVSRIESGRIAVSPQPTNLVTLANEVVGRLKMQLIQKNIALIMNVTGDIPDIPLDAKLVSNVYQNLLTNAIFYSPEKSRITLSISLRDGEITSLVKDEGIGIPEDEKIRIYEKFYRASNAIKERPDGSGLGLYIVKSIVESSGGKLWFESEEGKGSTFYFSLPLTGMKAKEGEVSLT